ncbi:UDP-2,3-diacylglucosamine diphosphatase [Shewanella profunda]|uniref:UDP-2,3-diacylglucosamine diphosphatase n=1 Tax=Shewanella profunda TaxID=254793 RepID=UPI00200D136F|nr:UDP-2,3-diacylglucosamine diphosphatase [Shewanella profunda]MCL1088271.1 UDP-2,3-diacylglucosamine diphosphatase [Shewanella profunda]
MTGFDFRNIAPTVKGNTQSAKTDFSPTFNRSAHFAPSLDTSIPTQASPSILNLPHITVNALWLSDIHLGCKDCKADYLLSLLATVRCQHLYLVGDIVDLWALKRKLHWPDSHNKVLQKIIELAQNGTQVIYLPGNHDELIKPYAELSLWNIKIARQHIHQGIGGHKLLMLHGDQFDADVCVGRFYAMLGDNLYDLLLFLNRNLHSLRERLGYPYWSLASYIKSRVGKAQVAIGRYRQAVIDYAQHFDVDGVICGHIHQPELSTHPRAAQYSTPEQRQIIYANDGDWVENCSLITETLAGELQLCRWNEQTLTLDILQSIALVQSPPDVNSTVHDKSAARRTNTAQELESRPRDVA